MSMYSELPTLPDSAESSLKINQSFHVLMNKFENIPDYGNFVPIMLNVVLNNSPIILKHRKKQQRQLYLTFGIAVFPATAFI